ncbi:hypothetical protein PFLG_03053 [Plasmodium falciparum RAJ116]|uniref:Uncharacterized protein n=1 Tax=Plasmodium falciparum RAJ116 TaxID=580058 RepID=A0A0L0D074_PLAFA|nr:hypothetical protein PFLG_03053 [Plasmodium falciparum RAJ116]
MSQDLKRKLLKDINYYCNDNIYLLGSFYKCQLLIYSFYKNDSMENVNMFSLRDLQNIYASFGVFEAGIKKICVYKYYPDTVLITLMVIFNVVILIINEILKKVEERIKINRQKYLKVLFGTRLGMWSPK